VIIDPKISEFYLLHKKYNINLKIEMINNDRYF